VALPQGVTEGAIICKGARRVVVPAQERDLR